MKKLATIVLGLSLIGTVSPLMAKEKTGEHKKPVLTEDQKKIVEKYDTNKDGKLTKEEYAKVSAEDKEKLPKRAGKKKAGAGAAEKKAE